MPSFLHEILVQLFRDRPALGPELLRACAGIELDGTAHPGSIDLSQVVPTEYRSDAVAVLRGLEDVALAVVIVEVQLREDDDKLRTWPLYVAAARASYRCPAMLLVLAPDPAVARWASQVIELGHPGFALRPVAIGYDRVPRVPDAAAACEAPELAVLSAMAHRDLESARTARAGISRLAEDQQKLYWDVILKDLPELVRHAIKVDMIKGYEYQSDFARKYYFQGREEGLEQGLETLRRTLVEMVCARFPRLRDEVAGRVQGQPEAWLTAVAVELSKARDEDEVRAVLGQPS